MQLSQPRFATTLLFVSLCQILFILSLLPQLDRAIGQQLNQTSTQNLPDFFAVNIQEEDLPAIRDYFKSYDTKLSYVSPMVAARFKLINGKSPDNPRLLKRPLRLNYRSQLLNSESVLEGERDWPKYDENLQSHPWISVEKEYAERNSLKIGDIITFEIAGLDLETEIRQIRKIDWESFEPNFFIQFQDGYLNDFPKTWMGVVYGVSPAMRASLYKETLDRFSSMNLIDLSQTLEKLTKITRTISPPIRAAAQLQAGITLLILFLLIAYHQKSRAKEFVLFQLLGATSARVNRMVLCENLILSLCAGLFSLLLAMGGSRLLIEYIFDIKTPLNWEAPIFYFSISLLAVSVATWLTTLQIQKQTDQGRSLLSD